MKNIGVAIFGLGVVGGGTFQMLTEKREYYKSIHNIDFSVEGVLELNRERALSLGVEEEKIYTSVDDICANPKINIVVECIGRIEPAKTFILTALNSGKSVVTSNKELVSKYWHELERAAKRKNVGLYFEASCMGGVPIIRSLLDGLQANKINSIKGIVNGTTNYILTKMEEEGLNYQEALKQAQELGYAEKDPTADIEGFDANYKLSILSSLAFHKKVPIDKIYREGISQITPADIEYGKELGLKLKLLAIAKNTEEGIEARVHPTFIRKEHKLAIADNSFNAILVDGDCVGEVLLYGKGAGALPTASAIVSDVIFCATHNDKQYSTFKNNASPEKDVKFITNFESKYYMRITCMDKAGVLSRLMSIFARCGISVTDVVQHSGAENEFIPMYITTHKTKEFAIRNAVSKINKLIDIAKVDTVIRVED